MYLLFILIIILIIQLFKTRNLATNSTKYYHQKYSINDFHFTSEERKIVNLLADCVPFEKNMVEIAGSFPLKLFEKINNIEKKWICNDVDIFILNDYDKVVNHFKDNLRKQKYELNMKKLNYGILIQLFNLF